MKDMEDVRLYEEQCVIGRILSLPEILLELPNIEPEYFENGVNREIFSAIKKIVSEGRDISALSVHKETGKKYGGYLVELSSLFPPKKSVSKLAASAEQGRNREDPQNKWY